MAIDAVAQGARRQRRAAHRRRRRSLLRRRRQGDRRRRRHGDDGRRVRRHRGGAGRGHPVPGPHLQELPRHGLDRRDAAGLGRPLLPGRRGERGAARSAAPSWCPKASRGRCRTRARSSASSSRWRAACARRCTIAAAPASTRCTRKAEFVEITSSRRAREPRPRRADHEGSAELPRRMTSVPPTPAPAGDAGRRQAAMPFIMITVLIDMMSIGLIVPVLPALVGTFTASQTEQALVVRRSDLRVQHRQLLRVADARRAVRSLRAPAGAAARLLRRLRSASSSPRWRRRSGC